MNTKRCSSCKQTLPVTAFGKNRSKRDGLKCYCKACCKARRTTPETKAKRAAYDRQWRQDNPDYAKRYRKDNAERIAEYKKQYRKDNSEYLKKYHKQYRASLPAGVYIIACIVTDQLYVGSTSAIPERWRNHKSELRNGIHKNKHLQTAWDTHGEEAFVFDIIEECAPDTQESILRLKEQAYMDKWQPEDLFNDKRAKRET